MKKRLIMLGLGLAVVGTGIVINKLRKRNNEEEVNEVEETIVTEEVEEMVEMVKETEENNEEVKEENVTEELAIDIDMKKFDLDKIINIIETYKENSLKIISDYFTSHPNKDIVYGEIEFVDKDGYTIFTLKREI